MNLRMIISKSLQYVRSDWVVIMLMGIVVTSFIIHAQNRQVHFQDGDSILPYYTIIEFPRPALSILAGFNNGGGIISPQFAESIIDSPLIASFISKYLRDVSGDPVPREKILGKLTNLTPLGFVRIGLATTLGSVNAPMPFKGMFGLPWGTTYSMGPGIFYGLILVFGTAFDDFMSRAVLLTQALFHLTVLFVFFTAIRVGLNRFAAALSSLFMLFSISLYSYGYHLGSTVWNYTTAAIFLLIATLFWEQSDRLKKISIISAILIFFNYLIVFYWAAFLLAELFIRLRGRYVISHIYRVSLDIARSQIIALVAIVICAVFFLPLGESYRGTISTDSLGAFVEGLGAVILNMFSFYAKSETGNVVQALIFGILIASSIAILFRTARDSSLDKSRSGVALVLLFVLALFVVAVLFGVLGFVPTRHMLFLAPVLYIGMAYCFDAIINVLSSGHGSLGRALGWSVVSIVFIAVVALGFVSMRYRLVDTVDASLALPVSAEDLAGADRLLVDRVSFHTYYRERALGRQPEFIDFEKLKEHEVYLYLGQNDPQYLLDSGMHFDPNRFDPGSIRINKLSETENVHPNIYFSPYISRDSIFHNSFYKTRFMITPNKTQ